MSAQIERRALRVEDIYNADDEEKRLAFIVDAMYRRILADMHLLVTDEFDLDPAEFRLSDEATNALLEEAATQVVRISTTTREAIAAKLAAGNEAGLNTYEIAQSIEALFTETWANRATVIVRNEIGNAQLLSAADRYAATGLVDNVRIRDGDEDEPCASQNGTTVPLGKHGGLNHIQCTKIIIPILRGDT